MPFRSPRPMPGWSRISVQVIWFRTTVTRRSSRLETKHRSNATKGVSSPRSRTRWGAVPRLLVIPTSVAAFGFPICAPNPHPVAGGHRCWTCPRPSGIAPALVSERRSKSLRSAPLRRPRACARWPPTSASATRQSGPSFVVFIDISAAYRVDGYASPVRGAITRYGVRRF